MAEVLHGNAGGDQLNASADKTQAYGLSGNDTLISSGKSDVLLVGGSGDDSLIMTGGNGTLSGGTGADTFELTYSATKPLAAVIEDLEPASDKIIVNFEGKTAPELSSVVSGDDVIWTDGDGLFNLTLKSVRENDYFDGTISDEAWKVLKITNDEREENNLSPLTMAQGLTAGAAIRAGEITSLGASGTLEDHTRPNGTPYHTVLDGKYHNYGENLDGGANSPAQVVEDWMNSSHHRANILDEENKNFQKLGVGYNYYDEDPNDNRYYWVQLFADSLNNPETVSTADLLTATIETATVATKFITLTKDKDTYSNTIYGATIAALGGNDSISNAGLTVSISGGAGSDTVNNSGAYATINGGAGSDSIVNSGANLLIEYASGDGSDTISGFNKTSTLKISGDEYTPTTFGNDVIIAVGADSIQLVDAATLDAINIDGTRSKLYTGTDDKDNFNNTVDGATINALGGNDNVTNSGASVIINGGAGADKISNEDGGFNVTINGNDDNDTIRNYVDNVTINAGEGEDSIRNSGASVVIDGGDDSDRIQNDSADVTINGGLGDDTISLASNAINNLINYTAGEGNDVITGFNSTSTLQIGGGSGTYSTVVRGKDVIIEVGGSSVVLKNTADLKEINVSGVIVFKGEEIVNHDDKAFVVGTPGSDSIYNTGASATISGGEGADSIDNGGYYDGEWHRGAAVSIAGGEGADSIKNYGSNVTIDGGEGNDDISNQDGDNVKINAGAGDDSIHNWSGENVTINAGEGNDYIDNHYGDNVTIDGGEGADSIYNNSSDNVTIAGGAGNDSISLSSDSEYTLIEYTEGDGNDTIYNFNDTSTLSVSGSYSTQISGNDVIVNVGSGSVNLKNVYATADTIHINGDAIALERKNISLSDDDDNIIIRRESISVDAGAGNDSIRNYGTNVTINGGTGNDSIYNGWYADNVAINGGAGDDYIYNDYGDSVSIDGGAGNDTLWNEEHGNATIDGGAGDDTIYSYSSDNVTINAGAGADYIYNDYGTNVTIKAGAGNDSISNSGGYVTINTGTGNDIISLSSNSENNLIEYTEGDGNDTIYNFNDTSTLSVSGSYSTQISGNDVIVNVGSRSVNLKNVYASADTIHINGDAIALERKNISLSDDDDNIIIRRDSISVDAGAGNDSISNRGSSVTITGGTDDDYIGNDNGDNVKINAGADNDSIYNSYYANNVTIDAGAGNDYISNYYGSDSVSIDGGAGNDSIRNSYSDNVTINAGDGNDDISNQDGENVTINAGAGDDSIRNSYGENVTINAGDGNDSITNYYGENVTINAGDGNDSITNYYGENVTINAGDGNDSITNDGAYATINAGDGDDSISVYSYGTVTSAGWNNVNAGAGNDVIDIDNSYNSRNRIIYNAGDGNDTIYGYSSNDTINILGTTYTRSTIGNDILIEVDDGSILLKNSKDKSPQIVLGDTDTPKLKTLTEDNDDYENEGYATIQALAGNDTIKNDSDNVTIELGAGNDSVKNSGAGVSITGGKGNDAIRLLRGSKNNFIQYTSGDGNDTIWGITSDDRLQIGDGKDTYSTIKKGNDIIVKVGSGTITLKDFRGNPDHIIIGESGSSGGGSGGNGGGGNGGGSGGGGSTGGGSNSGGNSGASGGNSASGAGGGTSGGSSGGTGGGSRSNINTISSATVEIEDATKQGVFIDRRGVKEFEVLHGTAGADTIYAGDGNTQLWGGADNAADIITGGSGDDIFIGGKSQGSENFRNASTKDTVYLSDVTLSDITEVKDTNGFISLTFNTGNTINIQSSELLSAAIQLADGTAHRFNHMTRTWQA